MDLFRDLLPNAQSNIRLMHALPKAGPVDAYANGEPIATGLSFGKYTAYLPLEPGNYIIQLYPAGLYDNPLLTKSINLLSKSTLTIPIISLNNNIDLLLFNDSSGSTSLANSFLRFINLSPDSPLLTLSLANGSPLFSDVEYAETTGYYPLSPGIYNFKVSFSSANAISKFISTLKLVNGHFYTIYIIGLFNDTPQIGYLVLKDKL